MINNYYTTIPIGRSQPKTEPSFGKNQYSPSTLKKLLLWQILPRLKNYSVLLAFLLVLSGCMAEPIKPSAAKLQEIHSFLVVPVESPPLEVIPDLLETRSPVYSQYQFQNLPLSVQNLPVSLLLEKKIYRNPGGVLIAGLVSADDSVAVADIHPAQDSAGKTLHLEPEASLQNHWSPTFILAQEVVSQLKANQVKAIMSKHYHPLPMAKEDRNANLGNWHDAIESWYGQDKSAIDYRQSGRANGVDAIVEVGIGRYRIFDAQTSLMVMIKLIDPATGQVIARTSAKTYSVEDSAQALLAPEADKFKLTVQKMGAKLITHELNELGLPLSVLGQYAPAAHTEATS
ncbi:conserved hypothetical protein [Candidatus Methylobacter favarea]|uniref:Uncharacterized protein n=1 Tax=Candidatus Methylobacter favarea TaxID=2707345 RepID=A0A8S0XJQ1_9GAMM|nr:hypothetical protein [Candidatus Methylobacter favarea]CAA9891500.1 conserved hypothetical protein [Candidatus Methylobacter favarea]